MKKNGFGTSQPAVVALGGGHGLAASLTALRQITDDLTAIVTVADDGGSSGRLRKEIGGLPPGDLRMALAALCRNDAKGHAWRQLLQRRFETEGPLNGHAVGNLMIEAAWQDAGYVYGLEMLGQMIGIKGRVLPMSTVPLDIEAQVLDINPISPDETMTIRGQHDVATTKGKVNSVRLVPENPPACAQSLEAVREADFIILGPGSWFTSVLPHLLVPELAEAISLAKAKRLLTLNITSDDETAGFSAARHIEVIAEHAPMLRLDYVLADESFAADETHLLSFVTSLGAELIVADLRMRDGSARHAPLRLASAYSELIASEEF